MTHATVANTGTNQASRALYEACGFTPWHLIDDYVKPIYPRRKDSVLASPCAPAPAETERRS